MAADSDEEGGGEGQEGLGLQLFSAEARSLHQETALHCDRFIAPVLFFRV